MEHRRMITLGFSPCPNDTFIFDALVNGRIDTRGLRIKPFIADVETLNKKLLKGEIDVTKTSFFAYAKAWKKYALLNAGGAAGYNCGPLVVADLRWRKDSDSDRSESSARYPIVAIPGKNTTANLLFTLAFPQLTNKKEMLFSAIEDAVLSRKADAGVIIHESRFSYREKGLHEISDLGKLWKKLTGLPVPLGGIAIKRNLPDEMILKINLLMRESVLYAMKNPVASRAFVQKHAQEMNKKIQQKHIDLYVNRFTVNWGATGKAAIRQLFRKAYDKGMIKSVPQQCFLNE